MSAEWKEVQGSRVCEETYPEQAHGQSGRVQTRGVCVCVCLFVSVCAHLCVRV